jgi:hypothetical protein
VNNYEFIGKLALESYAASVMLHNAKLQRRFKRAAFPCTGETYINDDVEPMRCHFRTTPVSTWCENCQIVQPYHEVYIRAAIKARVAKYRLTHYCKKLLGVGEVL